MEFFILGPAEIRARDHIVRPKGAIQQALFAAFMSTAGRLVTVEALAEELWGTTPPQKMHNALQAQISRLRRTMSRAEKDAATRITPTVSGYQFMLHPGELDAQVFLDSVERIRLKADYDPERCTIELRRALHLWRGPAFSGFTSGPLSQIAASRYEEARLSSLELLFEMELKLGGHAKIIPELSEALAQNPTQENFCRLLIVALYRSGRQIDALNTYRRFRDHLDEELGVDPSPMLRQYESAILTHDPTLLDKPVLSGSEVPGLVMNAR